MNENHLRVEERFFNGKTTERYNVFTGGVFNQEKNKWEGGEYRGQVGYIANRNGDAKLNWFSNPRPHYDISNSKLERLILKKEIRQKPSLAVQCEDAVKNALRKNSGKASNYILDLAMDNFKDMNEAPEMGSAEFFQKIPNRKLKRILEDINTL